MLEDAERFRLPTKALDGTGLHSLPALPTLEEHLPSSRTSRLYGQNTPPTQQAITLLKRVHSTLFYRSLLPILWVKIQALLTLLISTFELERLVPTLWVLTSQASRPIKVKTVYLIAPIPPRRSTQVRGRNYLIPQVIGDLTQQQPPCRLKGSLETFPNTLT